MSFFRFLLVNSFSLLVIVLVLLVWMFRDDLKIQQALDQLAGETSETPLDEIGPEHTPPDVELIQQKQPLTQTVVLPTANEKATSSKNEAAKPAPISSTSRFEPALIEKAESQPVAESINPSISQPKTVASATDQIEAQLVKARNAYWDRQYDQSIEIYQRLVKLTPERAELFGELGNVFYAVNQWEESVAAFYQAASLLIKQGHPEQARQLLPVITALDREKADQLQKLLYP